MKYTFFLPLALTAISFVSCNDTESVESVLEEKTPRILAHRGGRSEQEENTLEAFISTYEGGCHGFETDVHFTADKKLVITHDSSLERMTDTTGIVEELTSEFIRTVRTKGGHLIPLLDDLLNYFSTCTNLYVEWEMKTDKEKYSDELIEEYCDSIVNHVMASKPDDALYILSSFDLRAVNYVKEKYPDVPVMLISGEPVSNRLVDSCMTMGISRIACWMNSSSRAAVRYAHKNGMKVNLWPGDKPEDALLGAMLEADHICTDSPQLVMTYIKDHNLNMLY